MPRNTSGIYTLPGGNPVTPGDVIEAEWANTTLEDVADALTNSLSRTGAGGMLAPFRIADGTVSGPGLSYLNETNTGLYRSGSGSTWMAVLGVNTAQFSTVGLTIPFGKALTAQGNASVSGTFAVGGATTLASTLAVTGALTATGGVSGNVTGNVTAGSGTSTFNDVVITGSLDMTAGSSATITGLSTPVNPTDAANKAYVDSQTGAYLALTGGTMSGAIAMGSSKITGLATPTADQDAATKAYVDSVAQGLDVKGSCRAATTGNITLSGAQTIDGVAIIAGDRVLVKDQSTAANNGIYVAAAGSWSRAADADTWSELVGAFTFVEEGTVNDNSGWVCTSPASGTLGVTAVTWEQFSGAGQITAGAGMYKSGNTLNVGTASSSRIVVGTDDIDLATTGVTASTYKSVTVDGYGRVTAGTNPTTLAGFGITDAYTQAQVDSALALKLNLAGGTMSGVIAMGANKITGLADPTNPQDAATKTYIDTIFGSTTTAAASAAAAASSASAAATSATNAASSATAAAGSATSAASSYTTFNNQYLGSKTSDPSTNNSGGALVVGNLYWNSTVSEMRVFNGSAWAAAYLPASGYLPITGGTLTGPTAISVNSSTDALKITQTGSGNALYIEDVAADATPFVVSSTGAVGIGTTTPDNVTSAGIALVSNSGYYPQVVNRNKTNDTSASYLVFDKDRAGAIVQNGDGLGNIVFRSFDGANYLQSAAIIGYSDGTPGTNDVPGRLSFLTTADGNAAPTERLRIANTGAFGLSGANYGTSGQVLTSAGAGAPPTWSSPAASAGAFTAVASGSLTTGQTVVLNTDGTVTAVSGVDSSAGTPVTVASVNSNMLGSLYDPVSGKVIVAYNNGGSGLVVVGTISGTSISFGTPVGFGTNSGNPISLAYDTSYNAVVMAFTNFNGSFQSGWARVGTVSGTSISFGTAVQFANTASSQGVCVTSLGFGQVAIAYGANPSWANGCWIGTISGTSISFGSQYSFGASGIYVGPRSMSWDSVNSSLVFVATNGSAAYSVVGSVSGTVITWGSFTTLRAITTLPNASTAIYDSTTGKTVVTYGSGTTTYVAVGTVSGSLMSIGTEQTLPSGGSEYVASVYESAKSRYIFAYGSNGSPLRQCTGTISGTNISVSSSAASVVSLINGYVSCVYSTADSKPVAVYTANSTAYPTAVIFTAGSSNITSKPFVGFSAGTYSNGATATINSVGSTDSNQSGMTVGVAQYVQGTGTLGTTPSSLASVYAGLSLSATKILVKG